MSQSNAVTSAGNDDSIEIPELQWADVATILTVEELIKIRPVAVGHAFRLMGIAKKVEPQATQLLMEGMSVPGSYAHCLNCRIKSPASLARKIAAKKFLNGASFNTISADITDTIRFTVISPSADDFSKCVLTVTKSFDTRGWKIHEIVDSFLKGNPYKGLHVIYRSDHQKHFTEVQFHTRESVSAKDNSHHLYEIERDLKNPLNARSKAYQERVELSNQVAHPPDLQHLEEIFTREYVKYVKKLYPNHYPRPPRILEDGGR